MQVVSSQPAAQTQQPTASAEPTTIQLKEGRAPTVNSAELDADVTFRQFGAREPNPEVLAHLIDKDLKDQFEKSLRIVKGTDFTITERDALSLSQIGSTVRGAISRAEGPEIKLSIRERDELESAAWRISGGDESIEERGVIGKIGPETREKSAPQQAPESDLAEEKKAA